MQPIALEDFDAKMKGETLQTMAWIRAGGLRLAPILVTWPQVDNPAGAKAFVAEVEERKDALTKGADPLDYWLVWFLIGVASVLFPIYWMKKWQKRRA